VTPPIRSAAAALAILAMPAGVAQAQAAASAPLPTPPTLEQSPYFEPVGAAPVAPDADGFLRRWLVLEPVDKPNRTNTVFTRSYVRAALAPAAAPAVAARVPRDAQTVRVGTQTLRWHAVQARPFDVKLFNVAQSLGKPTYGVIFHAVTLVRAPRAMTVRLAVGSNSASMWWLNGTEAALLAEDRRMEQDDVVSRPVTLRKGVNVLRGAVINGPGLSDFCVRFLDEAGQPIRDLTVDVR
jgi:hypothetical protein